MNENVKTEHVYFLVCLCSADVDSSEHAFCFENLDYMASSNKRWSLFRLFEPGRQARGRVRQNLTVVQKRKS